MVGKVLPPSLILRYKFELNSKPHGNVVQQQVWLWGSSEFEELYSAKVFQTTPRAATELEGKRPVSVSFGDGQIFATTSMLQVFVS
jgi:hypothetical protein